MYNNWVPYNILTPYIENQGEVQAVYVKYNCHDKLYMGVVKTTQLADLVASLG